MHFDLPVASDELVDNFLDNSDTFSRLCSFFENETKSHEQLRKKNLESLEDKLQSLITKLDYFGNSESSEIELNENDLLKYKEDIKEHQQQRILLAECCKKEKHLQNKILELKSKLSKLKAQRDAITKDNVMQETESIAALKKAFKYYSNALGASMILEFKENSIVCKIRFTQYLHPNNLAIIEINTREKKIISFSTTICKDSLSCGIMEMFNENPSKALFTLLYGSKK